MNDEEAGFKGLGIPLSTQILGIGGICFAGILVIALLNSDSKDTLRLLTGWATFLPKALPGIGISWGGILRFVGLFLLIAFLAHRLCSWLWKGSGHSEGWRPRWTLTAVGGLVVMFAAGMAFTGIAHQTAWLMSAPRPRNELGGGNSGQAYINLLTIGMAQNDFRTNEREGKGKSGYWRADVAGLHAIRPDLVDLSLALADDRARTDLSPYTKGAALPAPDSGYYFRSLRFEDETDDRRSPDCYAICAFPSSLSAGASMFIVSQQRIYYGRRFEGKAPEYFPRDPEKDGWIQIER